MPVRAKNEEWLVRQFVGSQGFQSGVCFTMPDEDYRAVVEFTENLYHRLIERVDWERVVLEASGRCEALGHFDEGGAHDRREGPCPESISVALLVYDRPMYGDTGGWKEAEAAITEEHAHAHPYRWHMPKELGTMFAAWVRACRKDKKRHIKEKGDLA